MRQTDALAKARKERAKLSRVYRHERRARMARLLACPEGVALRRLIDWATTLPFAGLAEVVVAVARAAWLRAAAPDLRALALAELDRLIVAARERAGLPPFDDPIDGEDAFFAIRRLLSPDRKPTMFSLHVTCFSRAQLDALIAFVEQLHADEAFVDPEIAALAATESPPPPTQSPAPPPPPAQAPPPPTQAPPPPATEPIYTRDGVLGALTALAKRSKDPSIVKRILNKHGVRISADLEEHHFAPIMSALAALGA